MLSAIVGSVLTGLASRSAGKKQDKRSKEDREHDFRMRQYDAEANIRALLAQADIMDYSKQKDRNRLAKGWDNFYTNNKPGREAPAPINIQSYLPQNQVPPNG